MIDTKEMRARAKRICAVIQSDVGIPPGQSFNLVMSALSQDCHSQPLPSDEEIGLIVMGDEDGEIPEDMVARYPRLNAALFELMS